MTTLLPKDSDNNVIPALRMADNGAHTIDVTAAATRNAIAFAEETKVISIYSTVPVYLKFGDASVATTNTDHFFPAGTYYDVAIAGGAGKGPHHDFISVMTVDGNGTLYISEKA